jgi:hypothetical protein
MAPATRPKTQIVEFIGQAVNLLLSRSLAHLGHWDATKDAWKATPERLNELFLVCPHSFCFTRVREAEPSAAASPARAFGRAAGDFFLTDWLAAAAVAAASEVLASFARTGSQQHGNRLPRSREAELQVSRTVSVWNSFSRSVTRLTPNREI